MLHSWRSERGAEVVVAPVAQSIFGKGNEGAVKVGKVTPGNERPGTDDAGVVVAGADVAVEELVVGAGWVAAVVGGVVDDEVPGRWTVPGEVEDGPPPVVAEWGGMVTETLWWGVVTGMLCEVTRFTEAAAAADRARVDALAAAIQRADRRDGSTSRWGDTRRNGVRPPARAGRGHNSASWILNRRACQSVSARASTMERRRRWAKRDQAMPLWGGVSAVPLNCSAPGWCHKLYPTVPRGHENAASIWDGRRPKRTCALSDRQRCLRPKARA